MDRAEYDIDIFLHEIEKRPAIWDANSDVYGNRTMRAKAWDQLVLLFIGKSKPTKPEKKEFYRHLTRRWKSLRDCYSRELKYRRQAKPSARNRPVYKYFQQLEFLSAVVTLKETPKSSLVQERARSSTASPSSPACRSEPEDDDQTPPAQDRGVQCTREPEKVNENDSDRMFLLSLLDPLKQIPEYARFGLKRKLMDAVEAELKTYCKPPKLLS